MENVKIERIEWARLTGERPRKAGCNSRLGEHGLHVRPAIARITTADGASGFGFSPISREKAQEIVGFQLSEVIRCRERCRRRVQNVRVPTLGSGRKVGRKTGLRAAVRGKMGSFAPRVTILRFTSMICTLRTMLKRRHSLRPRH